jgi:flagellar basal-body rod protein FlgG
MSIYTSLSGMMVHLFRQDVTANNIANVNTTGYKSSRAAMQELIGLSGANVSGTSRDNSQGSFLMTDRNMDMAVEGRGFFPLTAPDGSQVYTRDGTFHVDANGNIVAANGYRLDAGITVPSDATRLQISPGGEIFAFSGDSTTPQSLGRLSLAHFFNPLGLDATGNNLYAQSAASGPPVLSYPGENGFGTVLSGSLETSNVNIIKEMTDMVINQRGMEANLKVTKTYDQLLGMLINLKR